MLFDLIYKRNIHFIKLLIPLNKLAAAFWIASIIGAIFIKFGLAPAIKSIFKSYNIFYVKFLDVNPTARF